MVYCVPSNLKRIIFYITGSTISDFKLTVTRLGGETNASQVVLSSSSTDTRLVTKGPGKNTEGKRCYMLPLRGLSKVRKYSVSNSKSIKYF